jgi:hypothetical protein
MFTTASRNSMLDSLAPTHAALFTGFPGQAFTNEVAGGSPAYARKAVTFGAASGGIRTSSGPVVFDVPAATTVNWIAFATAVTAGTSLAVSPNGGAPKEFALDNVANTLYAPAHGITGGATITFFGGTPPTGLTEGVTYVAVAATIATDTLQVALVATPTVPIVLTGQPTTGCLISPIVAESFGSQGTFTLAAGATLNLNY